MLCHTEVSWLWKGRVCNRVYKVIKEVSEFASESNNELANNFDDPTFVIQLVHIANSFSFF